MDVGLAVWLPGGGIDHMGHRREQTEMVDSVLDVGPVRYEMLEPMKRWHLTANGKSPEGRALNGRRVRSAHSPDRCRRPEPRGVRLVEHSDASVRGQRPPRTGRALERMDRRGRRATRARATGPWQPRQVVGTAPMGRSEDVALVLDQHRRRHPLWWHRHRHRGRRSPPRMGVPRRRARVDRRVEGHERPRARWRHAPPRATRRRGTRPDETTCSTPRSFVSSQVEKGVKPNTTIVNEGLARWTYEGRTGTGISEYLHQLDAGQGEARHPHHLTRWS